jgi:hypothetical protein
MEGFSLMRSLKQTTFLALIFLFIHPYAFTRAAENKIVENSVDENKAGATLANFFKAAEQNSCAYSNETTQSTQVECFDDEVFSSPIQNGDLLVGELTDGPSSARELVKVTKVGHDPFGIAALAQTSPQALFALAKPYFEGKNKFVSDDKSLNKKFSTFPSAQDAQAEFEQDWNGDMPSASGAAVKLFNQVAAAACESKLRIENFHVQFERLPATAKSHSLRVDELSHALRDTIQKKALHDCVAAVLAHWADAIPNEGKPTELQADLRGPSAIEAALANEQKSRGGFLLRTKRDLNPDCYAKIDFMEGTRTRSRR